MNPTIIVIAFNRVHSIKRLLDSLSNANYDGQKVNLCICIDFQNSQSNRDVNNYALNYKWIHGAKRVIHQKTNNGLKSHILKSGDLVNEFGSIIMLEDDCFVSKNFYSYACQALEFYEHNDEIAGISLYNRQLNFINKLPFSAIEDSSDVYFLQLSSSSGQAWTKKQWNGFKNWVNQNPIIKESAFIPDFVINWPETSWVKYYVYYLSETNKYFVYPRVSFSTNFGDIGTNSDQSTPFEQVEIEQNKKNLSFINLHDSESIYDSFLELHQDVFKSTNSKLKNYQFEVDLNGLKPLNKTSKEYVLTSRHCYNKTMSFGLKLKPMEQNILYDIEGEFFSLTKIENVLEHKGLEQIYKKEIFNYVFGLIPYAVKIKNIIELIKSRAKKYAKFN